MNSNILHLPRTWDITKHPSNVLYYPSYLGKSKLSHLQTVCEERNGEIKNNIFKAIWGLKVKPLAPGPESALLHYAPKNSAKRKDKYLYPQQQECCMGQRQGMQSTGCISDQWKMLRKGLCLQLCVCSERRYWLKHQGVCLHETGSSFFHPGTN